MTVYNTTPMRCQNCSLQVVPLMAQTHINGLTQFRTTTIYHNNNNNSSRNKENPDMFNTQHYHGYLTYFKTKLQLRQYACRSTTLFICFHTVSPCCTHSISFNTMPIASFVLSEGLDCAVLLLYLDTLTTRYTDNPLLVLVYSAQRRDVTLGTKETHL